MRESCTEPSTPVKASVTFANPVEEAPPKPELATVAEQAETKPAAAEAPKTCTVTMGSTDSCVVEFEQPDANQCTVSSLTPLLGDLGDEKETGELNIA